MPHLSINAEHCIYLRLENGRIELTVDDYSDSIHEFEAAASRVKVSINKEWFCFVGKNFKYVECIDSEVVSDDCGEANMLRWEDEERGYNEYLPTRISEFKEAGFEIFENPSDIGVTV